jgi:hypothetical protein
MAATVKIDFAIGGADVGPKMVSTIVQATERATRAQLRVAEGAAREEVKIRGRMEQEKFKAATRSAQQISRAEIQAAQQAAKARVQIARDASRAEVQAKAEASRQVNRIVLESTRQQSRAKAIALADQLAREREASRTNEREDARRRRDQERATASRVKMLSGYGGAAGKGLMRGIGAVASGAGRLGSAGMGLAGTLMGGAGIDASIGHAMRQRSMQESAAVDLSNSAFMAGKDDISGKRVDPKALVAQARQIGAATATDPSQALEGLSKFTGVTGDLATGRAVLGDLAKLAKATGSNLADVVSTAGEISKAMGDAAGSEEEAKAKATALYEVMRGVAGQGKLGSIEMKDNAKYFAKIAAASTAFSGGAADNVLKVAALSQEARGGGGAWNAATAATSVTGFVNTLKTPARAKAFAAEGIDLVGEDQKLRDPFAIISEALHKTGGDMGRMKKMFANIMGERAVGGLSTAFLDASGGKKDKESLARGDAAVAKEFDRMTKQATMQKSEVDESFGNAMKTSASGAELFQQKLDQVVGDMADKLIPAMLKMTPVAEKGAEVLGKFIDAVSPSADKVAASMIALAPAVETVAGGLATVANFAAEYPKLMAGGVIAGFIAKELAGHAVANMNVTAGVVNMVGGDGALGLVKKGAGGLAGAAATGLSSVSAAAPALGVVAGGVGVGLLMNNGQGAGDEKDAAIRARAAQASNIATKIRMGKATAEDMRSAKALSGQLASDSANGGFFNRWGRTAGDGAADLIKGNFNPRSLALSLPGVGLARGLGDALGGGGQEGAAGDAKAAGADLAEALKNVKLAPDTTVALKEGATINIGNFGQLADMIPKSSGNAQGPKADPPS